MSQVDHILQAGQSKQPVMTPEE